MQVTDITALKDCGAPLDGAMIDDPPGGAGDTPQIAFDLDKQHTIAQEIDNSGHSGTYDITGDYFANHTLDTKKGDRQPITIWARTYEQNCTFSLEFTVLDSNGETRKQQVRNGDRDFEVSAYLSSVQEYREIYVAGLSKMTLLMEEGLDVGELGDEPGIREVSPQRFTEIAGGG
ncbi:hypothetical protein GCM10023224_07270 [Streptomonospora halophila]|uniref:Uncharacterized protein n=1 Tax=Streptomonospora halophila TaxID=427369 RepID=A0ABP9G6N4_9ACTN